MNQVAYNKIVPSPIRSEHIPINAQWLSGEGCGSWFHISKNNQDFLVSRYSPEGKIECKGVFSQEAGEAIRLDEFFQFTYLSHCAEVNIIQNNINLKFKLLNKC